LFQRTAIGGSIGCLILLVLVIPGVTASLRVLDMTQFLVYITSMHTWCFIMTVIVILVTPLEEIRVIVGQLRKRKREAGEECRKRGVELKSPVGEERDVEVCGNGSLHAARSPTGACNVQPQSNDTNACDSVDPNTVNPQV
jgi:hypothetical protein